MSAAQDKKQRQMKLARLEIVAQLFKRGYSRRKIREEVKNRLDLKSYSLGTVQSDVQTLLAEWREDRIENTDDLVQLELERIDDAVRELWEQWEKSKTDYNKRRVRPQSRRIRQSARKQRLSALAMLLISPRYESSLKNAASSSACTPLKRKTSTPTAHLPPISLRAA